MARLYPDPKRLFDFIKSKAGRKPVYTPRQIADEFILYIQDLKDTPIETETSYKRQRAEDTQDNTSEPMEVNVRTERYQRPPKVMDFVVRWLGMSHQWWYTLEKGTHGEQYKQVKDRIEQYCYDVKFDGAVVGLYSATIIARDLSLRENVNYIQQDAASANMTKEEKVIDIERMLLGVKNGQE